MHIDLMDGHYVPNLYFPLRIISDLKNDYPQLTIDVHMMVTNPLDYIPRLAEVGADYVSFHTDSTNFIIRTLESIERYKMHGGVVVNPSQRIDSIEPYVDLLEMVTLMAVEPGFAGQRFMERTLGRLEELAAIRKRTGTEFLINVDGAINYENLTPSIRRGANVIVTGIYTIFQQEGGIIEACRKFDATVEAAMQEGWIGAAY
jgi:ribulose-phosphate 3-epimerase